MKKIKLTLLIIGLVGLSGKGYGWASEHIGPVGPRDTEKPGEVIYYENSNPPEEPVRFACEHLKERVSRELGKDDPTPSDMRELKQLGHGVLWPVGYVKSLEGLEYAENLEILYVQHSPIQDFSVLEKLTSLRELTLDDCEISELATILSPLAGHGSLRRLSLRHNDITDVTALLGMEIPNLEHLSLAGNPLDEEAFRVHIPKLRQKYPALFVALPFHRSHLIRPGVFLALVGITAIVWLCRSRTEKGIVLEGVAGLAAAAIGCILGIGSQMLHVYMPGMLEFGSGYDSHPAVGGVAGAVFGMLAGVGFAQFLKTRHAKTPPGVSIVGRVILTGVTLGVACSVAVHAVLMLAFRNTSFAPMLIGALFGLTAGLILGPILLAIFALTRKSVIPTSGVHEQTN